MVIGYGECTLLSNFQPIGPKIDLRSTELAEESLMISAYSKNGQTLIIRMTLGRDMRRVFLLSFLASIGETNLIFI